MSGGSRAGGLALIVFAIAGVAWFALELVQPNAGYPDTDSPAESLAFLRLRPEVYAQAGIALLVMAATLATGVLATRSSLAQRADGLGLRLATAAGLLAAVCAFLHGVLRMSVQPLLHIDGLQRSWGEAAYLAIQMLGIHVFAQGALLALSAWAVMIALLGARTRSLPLALCALGVVPGLRLVGLAGPFVPLDDDAAGIVWMAWMASIPATLVWTGLLGVALLRRRHPRRADDGPVATPAVGVA